MERAKPAVARTSTGGKPTEMGVRYLSKNDAIEYYHIYSLPQSVERREGDTACKCIFDGRIQHVYEYALEAS